MRRSIAERLADSDLKLRLALRAAQIGTWEWDLDTGQMAYSSRARAICGFAPDEQVTLERVRAITHPDDLPRTWAMARSALNPAERTKEPYEYRIRRADTGEVRWVIAHGEAIFLPVDGETKAVRYLGTIADITERKATEQALRDSALRQRLAIEAARMAVWELDLATEQVTSSPELNRMFGLSPDYQPTIAEIRELYAPGEREKVFAAGRQALAEGHTHFEAEFRCRWPDGTIRWLLLKAEVLFKPDGGYDRVIGVLLDIDERKRSEERQGLLLRELNHRVKNSLSVIQSLATQSFKREGVDPQIVEKFRHRLIALAQANDILVDRGWSNFGIRQLVERIVAPYQTDDLRIAIEGDEFTLPPRLNVPLALILHELCTNAAKYGALSNDAGTVSIMWSPQPQGTVLRWVEENGPPIEGDPSLKFGALLISKILAVEIGSVDFQFTPTGVHCSLYFHA